MDEEPKKDELPTHFNIYGDLYYHNLENKTVEGLLILMIGELRQFSESTNQRLEGIASRMRVLENRMGMTEKSIQDINRDVRLQTSAVIRLADNISGTYEHAAEIASTVPDRPQTARPSRSSSMRYTTSPRKRTNSSVPVCLTVPKSVPKDGLSIPLNKSTDRKNSNLPE